MPSLAWLCWWSKKLVALGKSLPQLIKLKKDSEANESKPPSKPFWLFLPFVSVQQAFQANKQPTKKIKLPDTFRFNVSYNQIIEATQKKKIAGCEFWHQILLSFLKKRLMKGREVLSSTLLWFHPDVRPAGEHHVKHWKKGQVGGRKKTLSCITDLWLLRAPAVFSEKYFTASSRLWLSPHARLLCGNEEPFCLHL